MTTDGLRYPLELSSRMLPTDALFWYAEQATPELRPIVAGLLILDRRPARERLRACVERWIARLPRLRQRVVEAPLRLGLPEWEDDPHFELDYHAREVILPEPATERHLLDFAGSVFATPLDPMRPLLGSVPDRGAARAGEAACFFKVHHAGHGWRRIPRRVRRPHPGAPRGTRARAATASACGRPAPSPPPRELVRDSDRDCGTPASRRATALAARSALRPRERSTTSAAPCAARAA